MEKDKDNFLFLSDILATTSAPLDEIQAWSICYQLLHFSGCFDFDTSNVIEAYSLRSVKEINEFNVGIYANGDVRSLQKEEFSPFTETEFMQWLNSLGGILYRCLDYGLGDGEERELSAEVTNLIEELTTLPDKRDDEGIDELEDGLPLSVISCVREMCLTACADRYQQTGSHQRAVCRALYWHAIELRQFLNDVSVVHATDEEECRLRELDKQAWASIWKQLMEDLRHGVRLRAVKNSEDLPSHQRLFELTPYEMLLEDIRLRRYKLKPIDRVPVPMHLRASAHEMILEYIRSRPPLRPAANRVLPSRPPALRTPREATLDQIRHRCFQLRAVPWPVENKCALPKPKRKMRAIKPDFRLADLSDEDEAFPELMARVASDSKVPRRRIKPLPSTLSEMRGLNRRFASAQDFRQLNAASPQPVLNLSTLHSNSSASLRFDEEESSSDEVSISDLLHHRHSIATPASTPVSSLTSSSRPEASPRLRTHSLRQQVVARQALQQRHSVDGGPGLPLRPQNCRSSALSLQLESPLHESDEELEAGDLCNSPVSFFRRSGTVRERSRVDPDRENQQDLSEARAPLRFQRNIRRSVRLSLSEVATIRSTLARAEVESMPTHSKLYQKLKHERICFCCRKTEFGLLKWGKRCSLCSQLVCSDCRNKTALPRDRSAPIGDVSVASLAPTDGSKRSGSFKGHRRHSFLGNGSGGQTDVVCRRCAEIDYSAPKQAPLSGHA